MTDYAYEWWLNPQLLDDPPALEAMLTHTARAIVMLADMDGVIIDVDEPSSIDVEPVWYLRPGEPGEPGEPGVWLNEHAARWTHDFDPDAPTMYRFYARWPATRRVAA